MVRAIELITAATFTAAALTSCASTPGGSVSTTASTSAAQSRDDAIELVTTVAHAVSPDLTIVQAGADENPLDCTAPKTGQVYYSLARTFTARPGTTGASLVGALREQFVSRGFKVQAPIVSDDATRVQGQTDTEGFMIRGDAKTGRVDIGFDTACGAP